MRKAIKKLCIVLCACLAMVSIVGAIAVASFVGANAEGNYTLTFDMPSAREDWAESSKLSKDYLLDGTQTIGYQSADVYAGSEAIVVTETAGTTSGQAIINTHAKGPISSWDANTAYTVSFMLKGAPIHLYFDHGGMVILDDWIRPGDDWTYYEYTFTPSEAKNGADVVRYSFLVKVAEANKQAYIDDFYIEEYKESETAAVTVGSAIGTLPALADGKGWAVDGNIITADTVWTYNEDKTATVVDVYTLTFEEPSITEDWIESSRIKTDYIYQANSQSIGYQSEEVYAGSEAIKIITTGKHQGVINPMAAGLIAYKAGQEYKVSFKMKGSTAFNLMLDHGTPQTIASGINPGDGTAWNDYSLVFTPGEAQTRISFLFQLVGAGTLYIDNLYVEFYEAPQSVTVINGGKVGALPEAPEGYAWTLDGRILTSETVYNYTENKTASLSASYVLSLQYPDKVDTMGSGDYGVVYNGTASLTDGVLRFTTGTADVANATSAWVRLSSTTIPAGEYVLKFRMLNEKYVNFMYEVGAAYGSNRISVQGNVSNKDQWTDYEYAITLSESASSLYFLIQVHAGGGEISIDELSFVGVADGSKAVAKGCSIGTLPTLDEGYYWAIDGKKVTAETVWSYAENKVAVACSEEDIVSYTVTVDGVDQTVEEGGYAVAPQAPIDYEDENYIYTFDNWYIVDTDTVFDFSAAITQDYEIESRFIATAKSKTVEIAWGSGNFEPDVDGTEYTRIRLNTVGTAWSANLNGTTEDKYLAYTKLNGRTVKEINEAAAANGAEELIKAYIRNGGSFGFYGLYIPNAFTEISAADVYTVTIEAGWAYEDNGTGNTYANSKDVTFYFRDKTFQQNTGVNKDINATADFTFANQGDQSNGATCFILNTKDVSGLWIKTNGTIGMGNPSLNWIYINGRSIKDWNADAQAALNAGDITDICYGSTNTQNTNAGAPIAVRPGYANTASNGAFFQIWIANEFLSAEEIYSFEFKAGFSFMFTDTNDRYYMSEGVKFEKVNEAWVNSNNIFTVTVQDYDGTVLDIQRVVGGKKAEAVADPSRPMTSTAVYTFEGWKDLEGNDFDFSSVITGDITVIAQYSEQSTKVQTTEILEVKFIYTTSTDNWLIFTISNHDYTCETANAGYVVSAEELNRIGFLENVVLKGAIVLGEETVEEATLQEVFAANGAGAIINYWGEGTFGLRVRKTPAYNSIEEITVIAGTRFPSYQYACVGNTAVDLRYMTVSDAVFKPGAAVQGTNGSWTTPFGSTSSSGYEIFMSQGASVRMKNLSDYDGSENYMETEGYKQSGIRFQTNIAISTVEQLQKLLGNTYESVTFGTLIVPSENLVGGQFTHDWLEANGVTYMDVESSAWISAEDYAFAKVEGDYVIFYGSIVNMKTQNHSRFFSGVGYIKIQKGEETIYYYAPYNFAYSRSIVYIAQAAVADRSENQTDEYDNKIAENNNWSPYTEGEIAFLKLYMGTLVDSEVEQVAFQLTSTGALASVSGSRNTGALTVNKKLNGAYVQLNYSTDIDVWGKFYYQNSAGTKSAVEDFYLPKGSSQHKQFLDLFRKNGVGKLAGLTQDDIYLTKIEFQNATVDKSSSGVFKFLGLYSTAKNMGTLLSDGSYGLEVYLTKTLDNNGGEMTVGAHLGLGGALTYLAKSGIYEGVTSGTYNQGSVLMRTSTESFVSQRNTNWWGTSKESGHYGHATSSKPGDGAVNLINNYDVGRQIQQSWYANVGGTLNGNTGANGYTRLDCDTGDGGYWPYNPVQAGDCNDNPSQIIDYEVNEAKGYIYVKSRAMDWAYGTVTNGSTTKSYMENYYRLNTDGTVYVNNIFVEWNGFTDMGSCDFCLVELPAFIPVHTLNHFFTYDGNAPWTGDALTMRNDLSIWTSAGDPHYQSRIDGNADGTLGEEWVAWANDHLGSVALGLYIPNVTRFVSGRYETAVTTATSSNVNAKSNCLSSKGLMSNMQSILRTYQSCYVSNTSYTAPGIEFRMEAYKPINYTYVLSVNHIDTVRSQFEEIYRSGKVTNAGSKQGEKVGLDSWAREDKIWTQF